MGDWYRVVKTIKGHRYVYVQQTYREGGRVRTRNRYIGPAADGGGAGVTGAGSASGADNSPLAVTKTTLLQGAVSFGKAMADQFDAGKWGSDTTEQLGLATPSKKPSKRRSKITVTTTTRHHQHQTMEKVRLYDPEDVSVAGRIKTAAVEKVFSRIPDGTTDPRGYIVKRTDKLFPTEKLTEELRSYLGIHLAGDGSIVEGLHINKIGFTEDVALHRVSKQTDNPDLSAVTTTDAEYTDSNPNVGIAANTSRSGLQPDAHRKYFTNEDIRITSPADAVRLCREMLGTEDAIDQDKEHYYVIHLNIRSKVTLIEVVSIGIVSSAVVHPRETFRRAIAEGSSGIIIAHNHPSGEVDPSDEDRKVTKLMIEAGKIIGIDMLDHVVFSDSKAFSFRENRNIE